MDAAQEQLIKTASLVATVLSRGSDLALVELTGKPEAVTQCTGLLQAGYVRHGLAGIVDGEVQTAPDDLLDVECMFAMGRAHRMLSLMFPKQDAEDTDTKTKTFGFAC